MLLRKAMVEILEKKFRRGLLLPWRPQQTVAMVAVGVMEVAMATFVVMVVSKGF